jgi:predicted glycosyltransferase
MRIAIDLTNSPHVPVFAPIVRRLEASGHEVVITARRFAQTIELAAAHELDATIIGAHGGASRPGKARAALLRTAGLWRYLRQLHRVRPFDAAWSHGSTDLPIVSRRLGIPHITMFDYEWATTMHRTNIRNSWRVLIPDSIPEERLDQYRAAGKVRSYPGLKESYYLTDTVLDPTARAQLGIPAAHVLVVLRPPPELALYHRGRTTDVFAAVLERCAADPETSVVVLPRTEEQRARIVSHYADVSHVIVPDHAIDALSLIAESDLVISAGGTMNREAVALGVPVYTVFAGKLGGVDEQLMADGRLQLLTDPHGIPLRRRDRSAPSEQLEHHDPAELIRIALDGLPVRSPS